LPPKSPAALEPEEGTLPPLPSAPPPGRVFPLSEPHLFIVPFRLCLSLARISSPPLRGPHLSVARVPDEEGGSDNQGFPIPFPPHPVGDEHDIPLIAALPMTQQPHRSQRERAFCPNPPTPPHPTPPPPPARPWGRCARGSRTGSSAPRGSPASGSAPRTSASPGPPMPGWTIGPGGERGNATLPGWVDGCDPSPPCRAHVPPLLFPMGVRLAPSGAAAAGGGEGVGPEGRPGAIPAHGTVLYFCFPPPQPIRTAQGAPAPCVPVVTRGRGVVAPPPRPSPQVTPRAPLARTSRTSTSGPGPAFPAVTRFLDPSGVDRGIFPQIVCWRGQAEACTIRTSGMLRVSFDHLQRNRPNPVISKVRKKDQRASGGIPIFGGGGGEGDGGSSPPPNHP